MNTVKWRKIINDCKKMFFELFSVFGSNILSSGLSFVFILVVARNMGVQEFGNFNLVLEIIAMVVAFTDMGINIGFIRFYSLYSKSNIEKIGILLSITFLFKISISLLFIIFAIVMPNNIINIFLNDAMLVMPLKLATLSILFTNIYSFYYTVLQSEERFRELALAKLVLPIIKIFGVITLIFIKDMSILNLIIITNIAPCFSAIVIWRMSNIKVINTITNKKLVLEVIYEIFHFSKWILVSTFAVTIIMRLDMLMLKKMSTDLQLGYYAGAQKLAMVFPIITNTLTTVLLPKATKLERKDEMKIFLKKSVLLSTVIILPLLILILFSDYIVLIVLGEQFINASKIFQLLLVSYIFGIVTNPISLLLYNFNKTKQLAIMNILQLILNYIGNMYLIPTSGALGATISTFLVRVFGNIYIVILFLLIFRKKANCEEY